MTTGAGASQLLIKQEVQVSLKRQKKIVEVYDYSNAIWDGGLVYRTNDFECVLQTVYPVLGVNEVTKFKASLVVSKYGHAWLMRKWENVVSDRFALSLNAIVWILSWAGKNNHN